MSIARIALASGLLLAASGGMASAQPIAIQEGSAVSTFDTGGALNPAASGFFLGGLEVDPDTGTVYALAHNNLVPGFSAQIRLIRSTGPGTAVNDASGVFNVIQQTRGNDLTMLDGVLYVAGISGFSGIYGITPGLPGLTTFASGAGIPNWGTSGLTFNATGTMARVTSDVNVGHHAVAAGANASMQLVDMSPAPTGFGAQGSDHVVLPDGRVIVATEDQKLYDVTAGAGNVVLFFDLTTIPGFALSGTTIGARAAVDPISGDVFVSYGVSIGGTTDIYRVDTGGSSGQIFASGFRGGTRDLAFGPASDGSGRTNLYAGELSNSDVSATGTIYEFIVPQRSSRCKPWDNGEPDELHAQNSQDLGGFSSRVADDFVLCAGEYQHVTTISLVMVIDNKQVEPDVKLELYEDCDGRPGMLRETYYNPGIENLGPSVWPDFTLFRFTFGIHEFWGGCESERLWISPVGLGTGLYYWVSSREGLVQGKQGQVIAPGCGPLDWTDGSDIPCLNVCTDYNFCINGDCCKLLLDNGPYALDGLQSIGSTDVGIRAADDFQTPPDLEEPIVICRLEAWMALTCPPEETFAEIYANECDLADGEPLFTITQPIVEETRDMVHDAPVYKLTWHGPLDVELEAGRNYWISLVGAKGSSIDSKALFLYKGTERALRGVADACSRNANEGVWKSPFHGLPYFTAISDVPKVGVPHDFAFRIYLSKEPGDDMMRPRPFLPTDAQPSPLWIPDFAETGTVATGIERTGTITYGTTSTFETGTDGAAGPAGTLGLDGR
ncbi:MAG: hypothetical protein AAFX05_06720 [Planctomycetota bacterium]